MSSEVEKTKKSAGKMLQQMANELRESRKETCEREMKVILSATSRYISFQRFDDTQITFCVFMGFDVRMEVYV